MSMYNLVMSDGKQDERGGALLAILGFDSFSAVGRFRDAWVEKGPDGEPVIAVYTRNGGGNRECWEDMDSASCRCVGCIQTNTLPKHQLYIRDADDDFDRTYCTNYFRVPPEYRDALAEIASEPVNMSEQWLAVIDSLKKQG